jgi:hypothetical protein
LFEKARVFEQAERLIEKHRERAIEIADAIEPESLRRLFYYLVDTVLSDVDIKKPQSQESPIVTHSITMKPPASLTATFEAG